MESRQRCGVTGEGGSMAVRGRWWSAAFCGAVLLAALTPAGAAASPVASSSAPAPGSVVSQLPLPDELSVPGAATAIKLEYATEWRSGEPTVATGALFLPGGGCPRGWLARHRVGTRHDRCGRRLRAHDPHAAFRSRADLSATLARFRVRGRLGRLPGSGLRGSPPLSRRPAPRTASSTSSGPPATVGRRCRSAGS